MRRPFRIAAAWAAASTLLLVPADAGAENAPPKPDASDGEDGSEDAPPEEVGFELGSFYIKNFRPVEGSKTTLSFVLHAAVAGERADEFERLLKHRTRRVRDQVIVSSRLADPEHFREPDLRSFRRRILVRLRRAAPELQIEEVYFSDFRYTID